MKNDNRPRNVGMGDLMLFSSSARRGFAWPVMALASISHRVAGVVLFVAIAFMLYALEVSLSSESGFETLKSMMASPVGKFITWGLLSALAYHFVAGIKHLIMDLGVGETLEGGIFAARTVLLLSAILIFLAAVWVI